MKWSNISLKTLKEAPSDAFLPSHSLLVRAGYIKKLSAGIFTYSPLMLRSIKKFENIVRKELNKRNCAEILMPFVQPKEIWQQSGRWSLYEDLLQKMKNRSGQDFCLGPTHEEVMVDYAKHFIKSYKDMPVCFYQIQIKFRDEIRPRFGLLRSKEFIMKDAYSFDLNESEAIESYKKMREVYEAVFSRLGLSFRVVSADSGEIGGQLSEEFHLLADNGEDELLVTDSFASNKEICPVQPAEEKVSILDKKEISPREMFATPGVKTIKELSKFLKLPSANLAKILFVSCGKDQQAAFLLRGCDELNLVKVKKELGCVQDPALLTSEQVSRIEGAGPVGSAGPIGLFIPVYMDQELSSFSSLITGAGKEGYHFKNMVPGRDFQVKSVSDFRYAQKGDLGPDGQKLRSCRGIEVGHIFYLGDKYSKLMSFMCLDKTGQRQYIQMGCYGIGITRTIQAVIEQSFDKDGMIWPDSITPFLVHLCLLDPEDKEVLQLAKSLYHSLWERGIDVFLDDRLEKAGVKFKDADLLGFPLRINLGSQMGPSSVEWVERRSGKREKISSKDVIERISQFFEK